MTIQQFRDILVSIDDSVKVYHGIADKETGDFLSWIRTGTQLKCANNCIYQRIQDVNLLYFTRSEYPDYPFDLEDTLCIYDDIAITGHTEKQDYDTGVYCYEWEVEVALDG